VKNIAALQPRITLLIVVLSLLILVAIILAYINKKLKKKIILKEKIEEKENEYKIELKKIRKSSNSPRELLHATDLLTKRFLSETFKAPSKLDYSELSVYFKKKSPKISMFCELMLNAMYSGENIKIKKVDLLLNKLEFILNQGFPHPKIEESEKIVSGQENKTELTSEILQSVKQKLGEEKQVEINPIIKIEKETLEDQELVPEKEEKIPEENLKTLPEVDKILPIMEEKEFNIGFQSRQRKTAESLSTLDEEQIRDAYKVLQKRFTQAYNISEKKKKKKNIKKLDKFRENTISIVKQFGIDKKTSPLLEDIKMGTRLLTSIENY
jgi:DNA-binding transcriptional regulator YiaG